MEDCSSAGGCVSIESSGGAYTGHHQPNWQAKKRKERNNIKKYGLTDSCHEDENGQYESDENVEEPIDDAGLDVFTDCRIATAIVHWCRQIGVDEIVVGCPIHHYE